MRDIVWLFTGSWRSREQEGCEVVCEAQSLCVANIKSQRVTLI